MPRPTRPRSPNVETEKPTFRRIIRGPGENDLAATANLPWTPPVQSAELIVNDPAGLADAGSSYWKTAKGRR